MGDSGDLKVTIEALTKHMETMQAAIQANATAIAAISTSSSSGSGPRPDSGDHHQDRPPKYWRPEFPRFDGKGDPLPFINKCESFFQQQRIMPEERVWMASYNLHDVAHLWYLQLEEDEGRPTWARFKDLLNVRFGPPLRAAPLFELSSCRRSGTVEEYQDRFQALLPRAGRLEEDQKVQLFTGGLLPPLSLHVQMQHPQTLVAAMSLARQYELIDQYAAAPAKSPGRGALPSQGTRPVLPLPIGAKPAAPTATVEGRPVRRLNQAEQEERRRLGLCFNCDEKYSRGHNKVCKRLFLLDSIADDDDTDEAPVTEHMVDTESPVFSLHAVAGVPIADTIQLAVTVGDASLLALLDSGSTHSFIGEDAAHRTGLPVQARPRMTATVANGERVPCPGVIRNAPFPSLTHLSPPICS
jgi:hypothetical protein